MQKINVVTGEKKIIQLPDLSTAGYTLELGGKYESTIKVERVVTDRKNNSKIIGGTQQINIEITGLKKGTAVLTVQQKRSWEKSASASDKWEYEITVE